MRRRGVRHGRQADARDGDALAGSDTSSDGPARSRAARPPGASRPTRSGPIPVTMPVNMLSPASLFRMGCPAPCAQAGDEPVAGPRGSTRTSRSVGARSSAKPRPPTPPGARRPPEDPGSQEHGRPIDEVRGKEPPQGLRPALDHEAGDLASAELRHEAAQVHASRARRPCRQAPDLDAPRGEAGDLRVRERRGRDDEPAAGAAEDASPSRTRAGVRRPRSATARWIGSGPGGESAAGRRRPRFRRRRESRHIPLGAPSPAGAPPPP